MPVKSLQENFMNKLRFFLLRLRRPLPDTPLYLDTKSVPERGAELT